MSKDFEEELRRLIDGDPSLGFIAQAPRQHRQRLATALQVEHESAQEAGTLAYQARLLVQCSLPYRRQLMNEWTRRNGNVTLTLWAPKEIGLPYGASPRLLLTFAVTEAVRTHSPRIELSDNLTKLMEKLGISKHANGRERLQLKEQTRRLFSTTVASTVIEKTKPGKLVTHDTGFRLASEVQLWWDPFLGSRDPSQIILTEEFYRVITDRPVPIDMRVIKALKGSSLALDIYSWLVYRLSYLKKPTTIPWDLLRMQFGSEYALTRSGRYAFKKDFQEQLKAVLTEYPQAKITADQRQGITLNPSRLAIDRRSK